VVQAAATTTAIGRGYRFQVRGLPQPKGSARAFLVHGKPVITSTTRNLKQWEQLVRFQLQDFDGPPLEGPVCISLTFYLPRPKSAPRRVVHPATRPDLSKLVRSVEDALTGIVYRDDAQIMSLTAIKAFATDFVGVAGRVWQQ